jgi:tetrahydromethanopterin S-methyltransferase subunit D
LIDAEPAAMLSYVKQQTVTITIGVSFFVFGFFIAANVLHLSERDILVGLISGAIGGVTMLAVSLVQERRSDAMSARLA